MIVIITGASHTGKTRLAQRMMEKHLWPYVSEDHIKMGLIRSGYTELTPEDDREMTGYLWPVIREMIKTAIENEQNLIVEGCYVPFDWRSDFSDEYLRHIKFICLCMSDRYIDAHFAQIRQYASCIEARQDDDHYTAEELKRDNRFYYEGCKEHGLDIVLIDEDYTDVLKGETFMNHTMITAHSGCEDVRPDSVDSVKKGIELGADAVEVDVQLDKNGRLYLSHDPKEDPSSAESLENVFRVIAENDICVNCDIKNPDTLFPILALADKYGIPKQKLILSGFIKYDVLKAHPEIAERARVFLHTTNEVFDHSDAVPYENDKDFLMKNAGVIADLFKSLGAECLNICYDRVDHEMIEKYSSFGLRMSLWTVNEPDMQRFFLNEDILNLTTLSPSSALAVKNGIE